MARHTASDTRRTTLRTARQSGAERRGSQSALRLARLVVELAVAGAGGLTRDEMLAAPTLQALYSETRTAADQALRRDLRKLCGGPLRVLARSQSAAHRVGSDSGGSSVPLVRYDPDSGRYHLAAPVAALRLSPAALNALCALAGALRGRTAYLGSPDLFEQIGQALPEDQRSRLAAAERSEAYGSAAPTLDLGLPAIEAVDSGMLGQLMLAQQRRQKIALRYGPRRNEPGATTPHDNDEVLEIRVADHAYTTIWCEAIQDELDLRLDYIVPESLEVLPTVAAPRRRRGVRISYRLTPEFARRGDITERLEQQTVEFQPDGSAIVSGMARNRFWARRLLLGYGASARALSPPALVAEMRKVVEQMQKLYSELVL